MTKKIHFYKYQGTGNDFVITSDIYQITTQQIQLLCDRKFGIGADGVIVMKKDSSVDFDMMYYNADGSESFCGNGSRCAVMHAKFLGWISDQCSFNSNDGQHEASINNELVNLKMHDVIEVGSSGQDFIANTGSPHYIRFQDTLNLDIVSPAKEIRYSNEFKEEGINVNFVVSKDDSLQIRTYERGVEDETLSCGTGVTASVIAEYVKSQHSGSDYYRKVETEGGMLAVSFTKTELGFQNIYLIGPAVQVFSGEIGI
ncbi:MAG: diaminopimelate epimerase [Bacteroidia bacterium]|nr:diaminopimelate epimerase [Bacteroidia bacterium]